MSEGNFNSKDTTPLTEVVPEKNLAKEFLIKNPRVIINASDPDTQEVIDVNRRTKPEVKTWAEQKVCVIDAPDNKGQDSIGFAILPDGKLNMVVADGVSGGGFSSFAARTVRNVALSEMSKDIPTSNTVVKANLAIRPENIKEIVVDYIKALQISEDEKANRIMRMDRENYYPATMLSAAQFNPETNMLTYVIQGDAQMVVFSPEGVHDTMRSKHGEMNDQLASNQAFHSRLDHTISGEMELKAGHIVMIQTDGIEKGGYFIDAVQGVLQRNKDNPDKLLKIKDFLRDYIKDTNPPDDIATICFEAGTKKSASS